MHTTQHDVDVLYLFVRSYALSHISFCYSISMYHDILMITMLIIHKIILSTPLSRFRQNLDWKIVSDTELVDIELGC